MFSPLPDVVKKRTRIVAVGLSAALGLALTSACGMESPSQVPEIAETIAPADKSTHSPRTVVSGLEHPWGMAWLPDGTILVTERPGRLRMVRGGTLDPRAIAGVPPVLAAGQGGLLDVAVHPQFAKNRWIYLTYAHGTRIANRTRVARAELDGMRLRNVRVIFEVTQDKGDTQHFGSRLAWLPDGTLLVAIGDGGNPPVSLNGGLIRLQAQNRLSRLGKVVRIRDDGTIPPNNPFRGQQGVDRAVWSYGHRNIQGLAVDGETGQVWASEHGARGGDELNFLQPGQNYGWPLVTHSREYFGPEISPERSRPGLIDPRYVWPETFAPSGLAVRRGQVWAGGLISREVHQLTASPKGGVALRRRIAIGERVRDVRFGPDGMVYVLTDAPKGSVLRFEPEFR